MTKIDLDHNIYIKHFSAIISMIRVVKGLRAVSTPASHSLKKWNGRLHEDKWNSTQLTARSVISLLVSSQCDGVSSVSLTLISYMCLVQRFNGGHSLLFRDWIVLFSPTQPPPPPPRHVIFHWYISVKGARELMAARHGFTIHLATQLSTFLCEVHW